GQRSWWRAGGSQVLGRQMLGSERQRDLEDRAAARLALRADAAAMQSGELLNQCQTNAGTLVRATLGALDAVKSLEQTRQFVSGNASAGVHDLQQGAASLAPQPDRNAAA